MAGHQPKELTKLAFASFTTYMMDQALQLLNWMKVSPISIHEASKTCREFKDFFHGTRLPPVLANEITKQLLTKLDMFYKFCEFTSNDYSEQILFPLVEVFMHPDVTSIELGPGYLSGTGYSYRHIIVILILKNVDSLCNLKTLSVRLGTCYSSFSITTQRSDIMWHFNCNENLKSIAECSRGLKSFKFLGCSISHISVPDILKLNRLETLHLLQDPRLKEVELYRNKRGKDRCLALINGISTDTMSDVLSASTLKSFGIFLSEESSLLLIVDKLPHLTEIILQLGNEFDLSCLTQLKNLRSLSLDARGRASDDYKKILPVLGKSLVFLDLIGYRSLDFEFIGETCSNLRCLHACTTCTESFDFFETRPKPSLKTFPNLRTVICLRLNMYWDFDWVQFLIAQCVNIKVLIVASAMKDTVIENILKQTSLTNLEEIHWYPLLRIDKSCLEELCLKCPNLRLVHGLGSDSFTSDRVVFDIYGCDRGLCKSYNWLWGVPDSLYLARMADMLE